MERPDEF
jgi:glycylpeptide N-tetradecanoyltransferase